ncbi:hypothetical protein HDA32_002524 [Spinactinospora alkalitolerans]|uniref:Tyrosine specific protein phosphatases domain-containing protein n=1 Tax=Spinactinospora alkalitolerans TaxID=687207 RepID=A0A852TZL0_9ACTN|nr:hypothetical protein [Spinactinospora alkalitolerans]NYE47404.1 hypothetical protein [Spinactinospora alkalitolerans]
MRIDAEAWGRARDWKHGDPRPDRAAGALLGAAAAACMVGAPAAMAAGLRRPDGRGDGAARLGWLITTALTGVDDPHVAASAVGPGPERAWVSALSRTVAEGAVPPPGPAARGAAATAWRAVADTPAPRSDPARGAFACSQLVEAVRAAHAAGGDEAAMHAGALAGARWGASGVPLRVQRQLSETVAPRRLVTDALVAARGSDTDAWPQCATLSRAAHDPGHEAFAVAHPYDPGVLLCNLEYVRTCTDAEAVVSLCRMGGEDLPPHLPGRDVVEVWLTDSPGANPNLHFVLDEAARAVAALRAEGKRVLLHCAACQSRTPAVAAHYAALACGAEVLDALRGVIRAVGGHLNNAELARAAAALNGVALEDPAATLFPDGMPEVTRTSWG